MTDTSSLGELVTEQVRPGLSDLDQFGVEELVDLMCADVWRVPEALASARNSLVDAVNGVVAQLESGGRLVYVGAGTAGRVGVLDAAEAGPTFNVERGIVTGVLAGGMSAFEVPVEGAEDGAADGALDLSRLQITVHDCVVGISASGRTPYVLAALGAARAAGAFTIGVACNVDSPLSKAVDVAIDVPVGPELIAGSTRLNAGTVQKVVLNVLSTASMVRLGKTYGNLMVDLRPTNEKLRDRAVRIVTQITHVDDVEARGALEAAGWRIKVAATMIAGRLDAASAGSLLESLGGRLRPALESASRVDHASPSTSVSKWRRLGVRASLVGGRLVAGDVAVHDGEIVAVGLPGPGEGIAIPLLVDAQVNGYAGVDVLEADVEQILHLADRLLADGVGAFQPTLITSALDDVERAARRVGEARRCQTSGARILGLHLEGPFLSPQRTGTHPVSHLRPADLSILERLLEMDRVSMITLAPELPGADELIKRCGERGVRVSLGHSAATAGQAERAFALGATCVTHLFNAMEPTSARSPGLVGAALATPGVAIQMIADGVHVADEMLLLAFAAAPGRCSLVSDAIAAAACTEVTVMLGEVALTVRDGVARRDDGTIAGSIASLGEGLARLASIGVATLDALNAVTYRPARLLNDRRTLDFAGAGRADVLVVDDDLKIVKRFTGGVLDQQ